MLSFLKIYPKLLTVQADEAKVVTAKLTYAVEQYGLLTGPFFVVVGLNRSGQSSAFWKIIEHNKDDGDKLFENFFESLQFYLRTQLGGDPIEEIETGHKAFFEMYFPDIHFDLASKSFLKNEDPDLRSQPI
jgi:hypothetical protein